MKSRRVLELFLPDSRVEWVGLIVVFGTITLVLIILLFSGLKN